MLSFLWKVFYVLFMLLCMVALCIHYIIRWFIPYKVGRRLIYHWVRFWGRVTVLSTGSRVEVSGLEHVPAERNLCLVGNHQSLFDIPTLLGWAGIPAGFIAKQELRKIPILSQWMQQLPCVFINRKNAREAMKSFQESAAVMKAGNPIVLFPEGTRAKSDTMGAFKPGSLKLPQMAGAIILPFAIKGTWQVHEIDGKFHSAKIKLCFMPPIYPEDDIYKDKDALIQKLHSDIESKLALL
jgi:1-acyl-sn-glycerol-3-phosphate acyltransferase